MKLALLVSLAVGPVSHGWCGPISQPAAHTAADHPLALWYTSPAKNATNEALPVGNGRLGALVFGGVDKERLVLDESSLWTGDSNPTGDYAKMGDYQILGNLTITQPDAVLMPGASLTGYRRELDMNTAIANTSYIANGVHFTREVFASAPAQVIAVHWSADKPRAITGNVALSGTHAETTTSEGVTMTFSGALPNGERYEADARIIARGGTVKPNAASLDIENADDVVILIAAATDYVTDPSRSFHGDPPHDMLLKQLDAASRKSFAALKSKHIADYQSLFNRAALWLGDSTAEQRAKPTDERKVDAFATADPELERLLFQYGRYLLISSSRPGGLPANLQGLWNDSNTPPWHCDYHANINIQMNYWPVEVANISECFEPFYRLIDSQLPLWRQTTAAAPAFNLADGSPTKRGFAIRTSHNVWGGMGWNWDKTANAWYGQMYWEHYAFTQDKSYLKTTAYPFLKETVEFWLDHLKALPDGRLVVAHGWSPEHGPQEDGVSYNQQIVYDLFTNYLAAAVVLGVDADERKLVADARDKLVGPQIGKWGQLQEWMTDKDDPNDHHRHTSNLFAVFPGHQVSILATPQLASAARVSLDARGIDPASDVREWSFAWRTALYARLHDGESAHRMLQQLFSNRNTCLNLFGLHPPMQLDGNFGITAGIAEMLLQSQNGEIELLPALPAVWPTGSVTGLRARGGYVVDIDWANGKLTRATIHNVAGAIDCAVRYGQTAAKLKVKPGGIADWDGK